MTKEQFDEATILLQRIDRIDLNVLTAPDEELWKRPWLFKEGLSKDQFAELTKIVRDYLTKTMVPAKQELIDQFNSL